MDFLEKLDYLMSKQNLNKSTLSKACDIPYTTIDGWYKKGYAGLKLTTLRKLSNFSVRRLTSGPTICPAQELHMDDDLRQLVRQYCLLSVKDRELVKELVAALAEKQTSGEMSTNGGAAQT